MNRAAIISIILDDPKANQRALNNTISDHAELLRGRMGIPFEASGVALIAMTVVGELDRINAFTGRLGKLPGVTVKASVAAADVLPE